MKKFLFLVFLFLHSFILASYAQDKALHQNSEAPIDIVAELESLRTDGDKRLEGSTGIELYAYRLYKLYSYFEQKYPDDKINEDLSPEIRRILPHLSDQDVYDYEDSIRFVVKQYRAVKKLIAKFQENMLAPKPAPIEVSLEELKLYDEPYITSDNELIVVHAPMKIVPYAMDKKNFLATEAAIKKSKAQSAISKKFDELKTHLGQLEWRKIPFYNTIYTDPFTGDIGIGDWVKNDKVKARILHSQTATGNNDILYLALNIVVDNGHFIPDNGVNTIKIDTATSQNIDKFKLFRPIPQRIYHKQDSTSKGGYWGSIIFPLQINVKSNGEQVDVFPKITFQLCDKDFKCDNTEVAPSLTIAKGTSQYTSMNNLIKQYFNTIPQENTSDLHLIKARVYTTASGEEYLKFRFEIDDTANNFEFYINSQNGIEFDTPAISINDNKLDVIVYPRNKSQKLSEHEFEITAKLNDYNVIRQNITPKHISIFDTDKPTIGWEIIWFAILGGFILNIMPCVFPVLGLKLVSLTRYGANHKTKVKRGCLYIVLGIFSAFIILLSLLFILKYIGVTLGWGMQFQSVEFLVLISFVIIIFLLHISGQINIQFPQVVANIFHTTSHKEDIQNYLTGLLLVLLSTPGSAPYLGTALGFALGGTYSDILIIMTAIALGLASPYILLVARPNWASFIPHPGKWLQALIYLMNVMLILTLLWLLSLISSQIGLGTAFRLGIYLFVFSGVWVFARVVVKEIDKNREKLEIRHAINRIIKNIALVCSAVIIVIAFADIKISTPTMVEENTHLPISHEQQVQIKKYLQDNKVVLIAVGADWCLTCKFNDFVAINNFKIQNLVNNGYLILLKSNQTRYQVETLKFMEKYGRKSLPFYLLYTPKAQNGIVLPELLTDTFLFRMIVDGRY